MKTSKTTRADKPKTAGSSEKKLRDMTDAYNNMREFAQLNGLDTACQMSSAPTGMEPLVTRMLGGKAIKSYREI